MNEDKKLLNVQKSCKGAKIVSKIIVIALIVATVLTCVFSIVLITQRNKFDEEFRKAAESGNAVSNMNTQLKVGPFVLGNIDNGEVKLAEKMESDIPALEAFFEENQDSPSLLFGMYCILISFILVWFCVAFALISSVFDIIIKEGNPFADKAISRTLVAMIIISVLVASSAGLAFGVLCGFLTWVIYTIMDYGRVLKIQSDETL